MARCEGRLEPLLELISELKDYIVLVLATESIEETRGWKIKDDGYRSGFSGAELRPVNRYSHYVEFEIYADCPECDINYCR